MCVIVNFTKLMRIGMSMFAVATFEVTSVIKAVIIMTTRRMTQGSRLSSPFICCPIQAESPDTSEASEMANPPPIGKYRNHKGIGAKIL